MSTFDKQIGRLRLHVNDNGTFQHDYGHGVELSCPDGWNDQCKIQTLTISVDEMRDLQYMVSRALEAAGVKP